MGLIIDEFESGYWTANTLVVGIDEAGRGPMAGPCIVCGVVFPKGFYDARINDSKKLSEKKRDMLVTLIHEHAIFVQTEIVDVETIDTLNIYKATQQAMGSIAKNAPVSVVLTDAMPLDLGDKMVHAIVKGDQRSISIAAASILAKTTRDALMVAYSAQYPEYGFERHKGYGTKDHKNAIQRYGRCPIHRKTFLFKDEVQISLDI